MVVVSPCPNLGVHQSEQQHLSEQQRSAEVAASRGRGEVEAFYSNEMAPVLEEVASSVRSQVTCS